MPSKLSQHLKETPLKTPCYVFSEKAIRDNCEKAAELVKPTGTRFLYSMKSLEIAPVLNLIKEYVDGFAASSLFEARLARDLLGPHEGTIHVTTPGLKPQEIKDMATVSDSVTLNSLRQYYTLRRYFQSDQKLALRINPEHQIVKQSEYDPCCDNSRLGVTLRELQHHLKKYPNILEPFAGLHFHTNCEGQDFKDLEDTVNVIIKALGDQLRQFEWINLGGGYYFDNPKNPDAFQRTVEKLQTEYGLRTYFEPGGGLVNSSGYLVSSVLDIVGPANAKIAVLDTTVNHLPEVLEFKYEPDVYGDKKHGHSYELAGASCLAADRFGKYCFDHNLKIGEQLVMENVGAYSHVKSHMFNGINQPTIYVVDNNFNFTEIVSPTYHEFANRNALAQKNALTDKSLLAGDKSGGEPICTAKTESP